MYYQTEPFPAVHICDYVQKETPTSLKYSSPSLSRMVGSGLILLTFYACKVGNWTGKTLLKLATTVCVQRPRAAHTLRYVQFNIMYLFVLLLNFQAGAV